LLGVLEVETAMPRRKKKPKELTDAQALRRLFPKEIRDQVKREAKKARKPEEKKDESQEEA
jgi:hypothetical protein